ncbi:hypothetical protein PhaeoP23_02209 [Phaeobacter piscinae]|uniref:DUF488 domain-containing protein n=1 Tax=Phaeobacter piscinae TaxID=1580596 RepID=A0ABM6PF78_9RHOB|nr:DUF488 domain-containing protein [Phaeobacter piscinae]ATG36334.1 hypothetical protein PhaeoP36_02209 [Phaeobacter piscinae]AUQ86855.1 hypothetical protein PhaeoP42_02210 [Phaeobacter piscinae]AUR24738.1 hypothetical protein PhaeoP23_02209 [Phaeobacter piscinae]
MHELYTIGYEGSSVDDLIATLQALNIEVLADVRELPLSRKKGLSKNKLAERLTDVGIQYVHFRSLGDPKAGRDAAKAGDFDKFERVFLAHLNTESAQLSLQELLKIAKGKKTCMMCFERCAVHCHRSYIADVAATEDFEIYNLVADRPAEYRKNGITIPRYNPRKGLAAAE